MDKQPRNGHASPSHAEGSDEMLQDGSLDDLTSSNNQSSVHNRRSLIQVMSIDGGDLDQDIYQYYLIDDSRKVSLRSSSNSRRGSNHQNSMEDEEPRRRHSSNSRSVQHECNCEGEDCLQYHCTCYNSPNEMCVANSCCSKCVQLKVRQFELKPAPSEAQLLKGLKNPLHNCMCSQIIKATGNSNYICKLCLISQPNYFNNYKKSSKSKPHDPIKSIHGPTPGCSCKKSHCLKKYCCCFAQGQKCGPECECEQCSNMAEAREQKCEQKQSGGEAGMEQVDIDQYLEDDKYSEMIMPESMEFELPNLKLSYHN